MGQKENDVAIGSRSKILLLSTQLTPHGIVNAIYLDALVDLLVWKQNPYNLILHIDLLVAFHLNYTLVNDKKFPGQESQTHPVLF